MTNKLGYNPVIQKYDPPFVESSIKTDGSLDEQHAFIPKSEKEKEKDFINEKDSEKIETSLPFKDWRNVWKSVIKSGEVLIKDIIAGQLVLPSEGR